MSFLFSWRIFDNFMKKEPSTKFYGIFDYFQKLMKMQNFEWSNYVLT